MIRINQIKLPVGHTEQELTKTILHKLRINKEELKSYQIVKKSIDARKKPDIYYTYSVDIKIKEEKKILRRRKDRDIQEVSEQFYAFPESGTVNLKERPVIVGTGPAGLFCGLFLARAGYLPILIERGEPVEDRIKTVQKFWNKGILKENSNVQFGEGGAGTFSDGKLNTLVKDSGNRNQAVLKEFVKAGAPEEILYLSKPHIGTDILTGVVKNIREEILDCGGEIFFSSCLTDVYFEDQKIKEIEITKTDTGEKIRHACQVLVLALGHSARDTFSMLYGKKIAMTAKSFALGIRIQHPQELINVSQYGNGYSKELPAASYKLTKQTSNGRGVYSFCMCPGGFVVNSSSEKNRLAINGMSNHDRGGKNANSALIVTVSPSDFSSDSPLAGMEYQRILEERAYLEGKGRIPVQLYEDFCQNRTSKNFGNIQPEFKGEISFGNLNKVLPCYVSKSLMEGIEAFGHMIEGFNRKDSILAGIETRTSSPVRIMRTEQFESNIGGIYPCGEGAGYAGGITSAAMDGIKVAEAIAKRYKNLMTNDKK